MAMIIAQCPTCSKEMQIPEEWNEMEVQCPNCNKTFTVSAPDEQAVEQNIQAQPASVSMKIPFYKNKAIIATMILCFVYVLCAAGYALYGYSLRLNSRVSEKIRERETYMMRVLEYTKTEEKITDEKMAEIKRKLDTNPDLYLPATLMMFERKDPNQETFEMFRTGLKKGVGGAIYYIFNKLDTNDSLITEKMLETNFLPAIVKAGQNIRITAMLNDRMDKLSPKESKLVKLSDEFLKNEKTPLKIEGDMDSAVGCFTVFENKVCYVPMNDKKPKNLKVNGKQWEDPDYSFTLDSKIYLCQYGKEKINITNCHIMIWNDSLSVYVKPETTFKLDMCVAKKKE